MQHLYNIYIHTVIPEACSGKCCISNSSEYFFVVAALILLAFQTARICFSWKLFIGPKESIV